MQQLNEQQELQLKTLLPQEVYEFYQFQKEDAVK